MRIPSTKRICFVGKRRDDDTPTNGYYEQQLKGMESKFQPRDVTEEMNPRNCRRVARETVDLMTRRIVEFFDARGGVQPGKVILLFKSILYPIYVVEKGYSKYLYRQKLSL